MTTTADDVWRLLAELIESQKETYRRFQEIERFLKEQNKETQRQIRLVNQELGSLGNRLGEFLEWQVRPAAVRLFQERGIAVRELLRDISVNDGNEGIEVDLLVVDTTQAVAIEVKSKLTKSDVDEHLERLNKFKRLLPRYQNIQLLGAVAAMVTPSEIARYAYRQGLFVITQSGEDLVIVNDTQFQPKVWQGKG
ncbi:hypothetical protein [Cyanobacterium aponinum]|uniref:hypothetical protein n=1 Tax=Cyanobacterium aponinum TaxID=379064 RepID=UPI000C12AD91|nr:hypothetical protein [Cyanobacterium aponinum]PHV63429.1 hypothetical protein CSQ80_05360 [Cyanobacterium aponinum IPPAS B-1201]